MAADTLVVVVAALSLESVGIPLDSYLEDNAVDRMAAAAFVASSLVTFEVVVVVTSKDTGMAVDIGKDMEEDP